MYHGISAHNRASRIYELMKRIAILGCEVDACWADRPIGPVGVYCDIEDATTVQYIADRDVYSEIGCDMKREVPRTSFTDDADIHWVEPGDDLYALYCEYSRKAEAAPMRKPYAEISACAAPAAVWVNRRYGVKWVKIGRVLARRFGLHLIILNEK